MWHGVLLFCPPTPVILKSLLGSLGHSNSVILTFPSYFLSVFLLHVIKIFSTFSSSRTDEFVSNELINSVLQLYLNCSALFLTDPSFHSSLFFLYRHSICSSPKKLTNCNFIQSPLLSSEWSEVSPPIYLVLWHALCFPQILGPLLLLIFGEKYSFIVKLLLQFSVPSLTWAERRVVKQRRSAPWFLSCTLEFSGFPHAQRCTSTWGSASTQGTAEG